MFGSILAWKTLFFLLLLTMGTGLLAESWRFHGSLKANPSVLMGTSVVPVNGKTAECKSVTSGNQLLM